MIERQPFGTTPDGAAATRYVLVAGSARVAVTDYGATLLSVEVPDRNGRAGDVLLGYGSLEGYLGPNPACYGGTIGPVANRTDRAEVPLAGAVYHLPGNDGPDAANNLHTDLDRGLHRRVWSAQADDAANAVRMTCRMADGELGLPGNRTFSASFSLAEKDGAAELTISYACESDATTYVNMTNHGYYNLAGHASGSVLDELVTLDADAFLPVREDSVSEGEVRDVAGTPYFSDTSAASLANWASASYCASLASASSARAFSASARSASFMDCAASSSYFFAFSELDLLRPSHLRDSATALSRSSVSALTCAMSSSTLGCAACAPSPSVVVVVSSAMWPPFRPCGRCLDPVRGRGMN